MHIHHVRGEGGRRRGEGEGGVSPASSRGTHVVAVCNLPAYEQETDPGCLTSDACPPRRNMGQCPRAQHFAFCSDPPPCIKARYLPVVRRVVAPYIYFVGTLRKSGIDRMKWQYGLCTLVAAERFILGATWGLRGSVGTRKLRKGPAVRLLRGDSPSGCLQR